MVKQHSISGYCSIWSINLSAYKHLHLPPLRWTDICPSSCDPVHPHFPIDVHCAIASQDLLFHAINHSRAKLDIRLPVYVSGRPGAKANPSCSNQTIFPASHKPRLVENKCSPHLTDKIRKTTPASQGMTALNGHEEGPAKETSSLTNSW